MIRSALAALAPLFLLACAGAPNDPAPKSPEGPTPTTTTSPAPATGAPAAATPTTPSPAAAPSTTAATAGSTPAPAGSSRLESAVRTKTTSAGGSYAVGTVSSNGITEAEVIGVLDGAASKTDGCYVPLFKKQLVATGRTTFEVEIDTKGKSKTVTLKENETKDGPLVKCLEDVVKKLVWPAPKAGAKATVQWVVKGN